MSTPPYVTPVIRALASQHGVALAGLQGTGAGGRIRKQDVLVAAGVNSARPSAPAIRTPPPSPLASVTSTAAYRNWVFPA